jgi:endonuclease/exonuclease/phosphatase family metal-dependent hydrolase
LVIKETKADIIALQEVENLDTLKSFQSLFLGNYPYKYLIDANDPRLIDVGVLSKVEALSLRTHQFDKGTNKQEIFSRDCLEVDFVIQGVPFTLFVNHFKAMLGGRDETMERRRMQAERVVEIVKAKYGSRPEMENFAIVGDLNDYLPSSGLAPLLSQPWLENVIARLPKDEQWTHWYDAERNKPGMGVNQLDYILLSKRLANNNPAALPTIVRKGLSGACKAYTGLRYEGIVPGKSRPAASDHCPVVIDVAVK